MKNLFLASFVLLSSFAASANTVESVYLQDSVLSEKLKLLVIETLSKKCPDSIMPYGLKEIVTVVKTGSFEGQPYEFYTTEFDSRYLFDGMHPTYTRLTVYSEVRGEDQVSVGRIVGDTCEQ